MSLGTHLDDLEILERRQALRALLTQPLLTATTAPLAAETGQQKTVEP